MGTKTIGITEAAYKRLKARKREDESFTDLVNRLLDETASDWREGFGTLETDEAKELKQAAEASRTRTSEGLATRQREAFNSLSDVDNDDEAT